MTSLGARGKCVITLGRVYQSHAVQAVIAITEWALFPLALELEVSYYHVLFIEEYFMLTTANWKLEGTWTVGWTLLKSRIAHLPRLKSCINPVAVRCRKYLYISHVQNRPFEL